MTVVDTASSFGLLRLEEGLGPVDTQSSEPSAPLTVIHMDVSLFSGSDGGIQVNPGSKEARLTPHWEQMLSPELLN